VISPAIAIDALVKRFGAVTAVDGITLTVPQGSVFGLLGRNGAGKTTTLETCIGLTAPTSGSVRVLGLDPTVRADFAKLKPRIGVQLQATSLPEKATIEEILVLYAAYYDVPPQASVLAERVGLGKMLGRFVGKLSGGEQQRLALAIALLHDPDVVFLDEPTAGMDAFGRRILWAEVERLKSSGKTIVLTTHYIEEAERLCDEIAVVQAGRIVAQNSPAALVAAACDAECDALGAWTQDGDRFSLAVARDSGRALATIVSRATTLGVAIDELDLRRPNLEDAFIAITGESLDESAVAA
jgi:ABC-2 type transport system ATP-binding protein